MLGLSFQIRLLFPDLVGRGLRGGESRLRILDRQGKLVVEGWAIKGSWSIKLDRCPGCSAEQPELEGNLADFGRASDVVKAVRAGLTLHLDLP